MSAHTQSTQERAGVAEAHALIASHKAALAEALVLRSGDNGIDRMARNRIRELDQRVSKWSRALDYNWHLRDSTAATALGMLGPNGFGPAIADVLRSARAAGEKREMAA